MVTVGSPPRKRPLCPTSSPPAAGGSGVGDDAVEGSGGGGEGHVAGGSPRTKRRVFDADGAALVLAARPSRRLVSPTSSVVAVGGIMDGYFSNFLNEEKNFTSLDEIDLSPHEEKEQPFQTQGSTKQVRKNQKRSKNYSTKEDEMLVSAWLNVSTDAMQGSEQSHSPYWERIHSYFHENKTFESNRSENSLLHRWATIKQSVITFCECNEQVESRRQSGVTEHDELDEILQACALFKSKEKKKFQLWHCLNILQHAPKWISLLSLRKQKTTSKSSEDTSTPASTNSSRCDDEGEDPTPEKDPLKRPIGGKVEKEKLRGEDNMCTKAFENMWAKKRETEAMEEQKKERVARAYALEEERVAIEKAMLAHEQKKLEVRAKELELKQRLEDERIMSMDTTAMTGVQQQYYMSLQNEIIARQCSRSG